MGSVLPEMDFLDRDDILEKSESLIPVIVSQLDAFQLCLSIARCIESDLVPTVT